jgi:anti-sigma factor RsiW
MRECHGMEEREALPLLARGLMGPVEAARLRTHVATCPACAEELALLERSVRLFDAATPTVDIAAIVAKLPTAAQRPTLTVLRGGAARPRVPRYALAAAASLTLVATLSFAALKGRVFGEAGDGRVPPDTALPGTPAVPVAIVGGTELADLGASELEALLAELDRMEATVAAEPISMQRAVLDAPEDVE